VYEHFLADAYDTLDAVMVAAYCWEWPLGEDELLTRLLALNLERAAQQAAAIALSEAVPARQASAALQESSR
jgi:hypothetical protein